MKVSVHPGFTADVRTAVKQTYQQVLDGTWPDYVRCCVAELPSRLHAHAERQGWGGLATIAVTQRVGGEAQQRARLAQVVGVGEQELREGAEVVLVRRP